MAVVLGLLSHGYGGGARQEWTEEVTAMQYGEAVAAEPDSKTQQRLVEGPPYMQATIKGEGHGPHGCTVRVYTRLPMHYWLDIDKN